MSTGGWRLLLPEDTPMPDALAPHPWGEVAWNMAVDATLFERVCANGSPPVLRLYRWQNPALTLGRFQKPIVTSRALPQVRRITGGRAVLHGSDLTLCVATPIARLGMEASAISIRALYARLAEGLLAALQTMGVGAQRGECHREVGRGRQEDCFQSVSAADIVSLATGHKLLGAALHRREGFVLMQASLPVLSSEMLPTWQALQQEVFGNKESLSVLMPTSNTSCWISAIAKGVAETLKVESWERMTMTPEEIMMAQRLAVSGPHLEINYIF